jgi:hypothetical protein
LHLGLGLPGGVFPSDFPTKILYAFLISSLLAACDQISSVLDFISLIMRNLKVKKHKYKVSIKKVCISNLK